ICPASPRAGAAWHAELLVRMYSGDGRIVPPRDFLTAAERYHLMPAIDRWVLLNAFEAMSQGERQIPEHLGGCAINLSGQSLGDEKFLGDVLAMFDATGADPARVCFEITETAVIGNLSHARQFIDVLRTHGCRFALDDFGSGLSSFSYLKTLPVDYLKIDGSFVGGMLQDENDYTMVRSIHQIGHVMGILTVAEFVEDQAILAAVKAIGVDYAQGYAIGRPRPISAIASDRRLRASGA
ncbi:MAG: EAL domain-containing protein, partial [Pseudomonadota bacterium]